MHFQLFICVIGELFIFALESINRYKRQQSYLMNKIQGMKTQSRCIPRTLLDGEMLVQFFKMNDQVLVESRRSKILKQEPPVFASLLRRQTIDKSPCSDIVCKSAAKHVPQIRKRIVASSISERTKRPQLSLRTIHTQRGIRGNRLDKFIQKERIASIITPSDIEQIGDLTSESITIMRKNVKIYDRNGDKPREIASLTKVMTCLCAIFMAEKHSLQLQKMKIRVGRQSCSMEGTSANLRQGDMLTGKDMLYAMMLPSGNDAAVAIAQHFGRLQFPIAKSFVSSQGAISRFIEEMNKLAVHFNLQHTCFVNSHGLTDSKNKSTSNDVAQLCYYAMKNDTFRSVVCKKEYQTNVFNKQSKMNRVCGWTNTNKLLDIPQCVGIKTGITSTAGPCMAAYFQDETLIVVLKSKNKNCRFEEVKKLFSWAMP